MKATRLTIRNLGVLEDVDIEIDKPLTVFFGDIRQGKSTILRAITMLAGGGFPDDIIRHGAQQAEIKLTLEDGYIKRSFYRRRTDGKTTARPIEWVQDGELQRGDVVRRLASLFNPFLLDQDYFRRMNDRERRAYLLDVLDVDTSEVDGKIKEQEELAKGMRAELKGMGDVPKPDPVEVPDITALELEKSARLQAWDEAMEEARRQNSERHAKMQEQNDLHGALADKRAEIAETRARIERLRKALVDLETAEKALEEEYKQVSETIPPAADEPERPDTSDIDRAIADAVAAQERAKRYIEDQRRWEARQNAERNLRATETMLRKLRTHRLKALVSAAEKCPVPGLSINPDGFITYDGTSMDMLSDSQIMELSGRLQALYPEGLGLELIDRAESLGSSVWELVKRAEEDEKQILATVVGEAPAVTPDDVGVFVVESGMVAPKKEG